MIRYLTPKPPQYNLQALKEAARLAWDIIDVNEVNDSLAVYFNDGTLVQESDWTDFVSSQDPNAKTVEQEAEEISVASDNQIGVIPTYFTWTFEEGETYINTNVTDLDSAKLVIVKLWQMNVAMRDRLFAKEVAKLRNP